MADQRSRRYFDSDVIIHLIENHPDHAATIEMLIEQARDGEWRLIVSAISMVEVTRSPNRPVDLARFARIHSFFESPFILVGDVSVFLASQARDLIYNHPWLYPMNPIRLAAAIDASCEMGYTCDRELIRRLDGEYGLRIMAPATMPI